MFSISKHYIYKFYHKNLICKHKNKKLCEEIIGQFQSLISEGEIIQLIKELQNEFSECPMQSLYSKYQSYHAHQMSTEDSFAQNTLFSFSGIARCIAMPMNISWGFSKIRWCVELISVEAPEWELIAARFLMKKINLMVDKAWESEGLLKILEPHQLFFYAVLDLLYSSDRSLIGKCF